ncbi:MAG: cysteine desulfurase [Pseudomonadota bacterium]
MSAVLDVEALRREFPTLGERIHGQPLVYLDNAATTQKPLAVIEALEHHLRHDVSNVHRGVHELSVRATEAYEGARATMATFLGAPNAKEIVFTRGATEAINLVAQSWGRANLGPGDAVLLTELEHHANIVPWQLLRQERGFEIRVLPLDDRGALRLDRLDDLLDAQVKLVGVSQVSNALGTVNPVTEIARRAHAVGALVLVDGAQAVAHAPVDLAALGADFYVLSSHKMYGPSGVGLLWGRTDLLSAMPPWQGGGDMILSVSFEKTTFQKPPARFEAGTPNIEGAIGMGAAARFLMSLDRAALAAHEQDLLAYATARLSEVPGLRVVGTAPQKGPVVSFVVDDVHPHDLGTLLDRAGVAVRSGHHCAQPAVAHFGVPATTRASFGLYNTRAEVDVLLAALLSAIEVFR